MRFFSTQNRPVHLGPYPYETLPRDHTVTNSETIDDCQQPVLRLPSTGVASMFAPYFDLYQEHRHGRNAHTKAPVPEDFVDRADNLKAGCYFLDADGAALCPLPQTERMVSGPVEHTHALVILVHQGKMPLPDEESFPWIEGSADSVADLRAAEIACTMAGYIRNLGYEAKAHFGQKECSEVNLARLGILSGLVSQKGTQLKHPFSPRPFRLAAVTTNYAAETDHPLSKRLGFGHLSTIPAVFRRYASPTFEDTQSRALHLGRYPMENVKRIERPTTAIHESKVQRVAKRAEFFQRALMGDLGDKAKRERERFATKNPYAFAMTPFIRGMVPLQYGETNQQSDDDWTDPESNARAIKGLAYHLGADMVGICEAKSYAWYTHDAAGSEVPVRHKYAVVMLIDQGYDTMEGSSGDDWISGAQSMRSYMRGAQIAGVMAAYLRNLGHDARSQTNADSEVLHIPLVLWAGLGELSRIGELVLNPFVGPRFKSVVMTTDMPLEIDKPVDFGLLDFCEKCNKCARECPCSAIPLGPRIEYNGYEIWKPDVERCTRYRVTNPKGSACGRCMKTCPYNTEGLLSHRALLWAARNIPASRALIAKWDDKLGKGSINPTKKWWFDLEQIDGAAVVPQAGTNRRDLTPDANTDPSKQKIALYLPEVHPAGDSQSPHPVDRKQALAHGKNGPKRMVPDKGS